MLRQRGLKTSSLALILAVLVLLAELRGGLSVAPEANAGAGGGAGTGQCSIVSETTWNGAGSSSLAQKLSDCLKSGPGSVAELGDAPAAASAETPAGGGNAGGRGAEVTISPAVHIIAPAGASTFYAPATIPVIADARAGTGAGVTRVDFFADAMLVGTAFSSPFSITWSDVAAGGYLLSARITDSHGETALSRDLPVTVLARTPPYVSLTAPDHLGIYGSPAEIPIAAAASAGTGAKVAKVEFFDGDKTIGTATRAPFAIVWSGAPVGEHSLTALVTDSLGDTARSSDVSVTVVPKLPPRIAIISPADGTSFAAPANIAITVAARPGSGATVVNVELYANSRLVGTATTAPYGYTWSNVPPGSYLMIAVINDSAGDVVTSEPVEVRVGAGPPPPGAAPVPSGG